MASFDSQNGTNGNSIAGSSSARAQPSSESRLARIVAARPELPLMAPFMAYLLLLTLNDVFPPKLLFVGMLIRAGLTLAVVWTFFRWMRPLGRPHWIAAIGVGLFAAWGWVAGQHLFDEWGLSGRMFLFPGQPKTFNPQEHLGLGAAYWAHVVTKIAVAVTVVPIVEEVFWRGFLLRALISWDRFEQVPVGRFTWVSFLGTSLLSTLEHPDNWAVSILCWMVYNGLFYWKRSVMCLIVAHGVTNLALYVYVVWAGDWRFW